MKKKQKPSGLDLARAVLLWAATPGNHGGNPYCHEFVKLAERLVAAAEEREIDGWAWTYRSGRWRRNAEGDQDS